MVSQRGAESNKSLVSSSVVGGESFKLAKRSSRDCISELDAEPVVVVNFSLSNKSVSVVSGCDKRSEIVAAPKLAKASSRVMLGVSLITGPGSGLFEEAATLLS